MSISSGLYVKIVSNDNSPMEILELIYQAGWNFNDHGLKAYLPIHDNDDFNWNFDAISDEELLLILNHKNSLREMLGVVLTWRDSNIGGEFLLDFEGGITVSLSINRQILLENITNVNWYLERIIPFIKLGDFEIENIRFEEYF
ncbi:hypothetical protein EXE30_06625 [Acinetobacter halotolerans]|uniref:Uncharacterized protein n=1 Tax=Acinetobacter halotolerans TaxID=1752076 RepID=A0A4Q6XJ71_9GAMM|nr:hypothetical protein [Acinetobacter halotolerans]RZF53644.1 hypothetical protein EXE30_06625 [Acinetobacter halotolerans]